MKNIEVNPVMTVSVIIILLAVVGGIWFFTTNPGAGKPGPGQAGGADPALSGPNNVLQGARRPPGDGGRPGAPPGVPGR